MKKGLLSLTGIILLCSIAQGVALAGELKLTAEVDKKEYVIGDRVNVNVRAENTAGYDVNFPARPEVTGDFSSMGSLPLKPRRFGAQEKGITYVMGIYSTGTHVVPPLKVEYRKTGEAEWHTAETNQVPVEVKSLLTGEETDIRDIKGLAFFKRTGWLAVFTIIFLFVAAVMGMWLWRQKKLEREMALRRKRPAHEIAYEELTKLKQEDLPGKGMVKEYYIRLSDITRHYLENRFSCKAPEMTTEEFLEYIKVAGDFTEEQRKLLKDFLTHCDMVKFAKYGPKPIEMLDSYRLAETLVDQTKFIEEIVKAEKK